MKQHRFRILTIVTLSLIAVLVLAQAVGAQRPQQLPNTSQIAAPPPPAQKADKGPGPSASQDPYGPVSANSDAQADRNASPPSDQPTSGPQPEVISAGTYPFTNAAGVALENMSTGTTQLVAGNLDDTASLVKDLGFEFWFDGVRYTQFSANANGLMRLGATAVGTTFTNDLASATNVPQIAPYWDDLWTGYNGKVHYKVIGSAPNRKLVVEWLNEQIPRVAGNLAGAGTFQAWLFETTGVIEFVYGSGIGANATNGGYSVGFGSSATQFASVTTTGPTVAYGTANNTQTNAITSGTAYIFTPNVPAAPTGLNFTGVSQTAMTVNWTDNATTEAGYAIYRSTDGTNYSYVTQLAANSTSYAVTGLLASTTYFWRVYAVSEGALSTVLAGSQATLAPVAISSTAAGGLWSSTTTWVGGVIPTASSAVTIVSLATVTIDTAAVAYSVTVNSNGLLTWDSAVARTLVLGGPVTVDGGGAFNGPSTGTVTTHMLTVGGDMINNGQIDFNTNGGTAGADVTFTGAANAVAQGSGGGWNFRNIIVNKGTSSASVLDWNPPVFSDNLPGFLTLTNGTFKVSAGYSLTNQVFTTAAYTIPATAGFWLNNPNFTVAGTASGGTTTNNGLLRVTQGTYNIGIGAGDQMRGGTGANFLIEGGTVNVAGAFDPQNASIYTQTGGTVNVGVVGNNVSAFGTFELFSAASFFNMSGGTINIINPSTGATKVDWRVNSATLNTTITGGTVVIGATGAPAASIYNVSGQMPSTTVNATQTLRVNNAAIFMRGTTVTNNGTIDYTGANARYDFGSQTGAMSYGGTGIFGTLATPAAGVGISANSLFLTTLNAPIFVNRVNLFQGGFINSNQITLGNAGASTTVVQTGSAGLTTIAGSFDVSPVHNQGTGGEILIFAFETQARNTGFEVNPTRNVTSMSLDNASFPVNISGGNITATSAAAALTLTNGRFVTGANVLYLSSGTATVTRTNGYIEGNFRKNYTAVASKLFEVGTANGYSPVTVNVTAGTFPADVTVKATQTAMPSIPSPSLALQRYWTLTATGLTADLTFNYLDPTDIPGTATEANFVIFKYDGALTQPGGTVTPATNQAVITGVTGITADWSLAEPAGANTPTATNTVPATSTRTATPTNVPGTATPTATATVCSVVIGTIEGFESGTLGTYTSTVATCVPGGCGWASVTTAAHSGTRSAFAPDLNNISDQYLTTISAVNVPAGATLSFWHRWALENTFDGGVLEFSTDGGTTWTDGGALITQNGYNGTISTGFQSPIAGRQAWTGNPNGTNFVESRANLASFAGQNLLIRFREANDNSVAATGWWVDDIAILTACVTPGTSTPTATTTRTATGTTPPTGTVTRTSSPTNTIPPTTTSTRTATATNTVPPTNTPTGTVVVPTNTPTTPPTDTPVAGTSTPTITPNPTTCPIQFNDVPVGSTFYEFIRCLACRGIVNGYPCGGPGEPCPGNYFRPNNNVTRGQVSKIVSEAAGFAEVVPSTQWTFQDVPPSGTFWLWVERLSGRGIIGGYACGSNPFEPCVAPDNRPYFRPNNDVTRGQLSKIVSGAAGWTETPTGQTFQDVAPGSTFYLWIERIASRGIVNGYPCGGLGEPCITPGNRPYFRPFNNATRGQMSKIAASAFFPGCATPAKRP